MDFQNLKSGIYVWIWELYFSIDSTRSQQSRVENIDSVCCHNDFNSLSCFETIKLIQQLQHSSLHFRVSPLSFHSWTSDWVDLIDENNARWVLSCHNEQLSDHSCTFSDVLLNEFRSTDSYECAISMMSNGSGQESFSCTWRTIHKDSLWLSNTERFENLRMFYWQLNDFLNLFDLLIQTTDHVISWIGDFFNLH